jgi:trehalose 6-phosphate phosphatase
MKHIFSRAGRRALQLALGANAILVFDYDGTLAPITQDPERGEMRPETRNLLRAVAKRYRCAVISGRARGDVLRFVGDLGLAEVVGNHGAEWSDTPHADSVRQRVLRWRAQLGALPEGIHVEDKLYSLAIHYRACVAPESALSAINHALAPLDGVTPLYGKKVVDLIPHAAPDKGTAVKRLRNHLNSGAVLYVGDDTTDESVFALSEPDWLLTIRVGKGPTLARWFLDHQGQIDALLSAADQFPRR